MKYPSDDFKKFQFEGKVSLDTKKIIFKMNIWNPDHPRQIPTINRSQNSFVKLINRITINRNMINSNNLIKMNFNSISNPEKPINKYKPPVVYILNATSLVKPHGIESLRCDVFQLRSDIVIITESWLKSHHSDGLITIDGYSSFGKERVKKRGGGVLIYIKSNITADVFEPVNKDNIDALETLIVKCTFNNIDHFICGLYHPPKASYSEARLISHRDNISKFMLDHNNRLILGGDFNSLSHNSLTQTGLQSIYYGPTHKVNNLDRLYGINIDPKFFNPNTYVSYIKTHHFGVIALSLNIAPSHNIITLSIHTYRRRRPNQHKTCLDYLSSSSFNLKYDNITESVDSFYTIVDNIFKQVLSF